MVMGMGEDERSVTFIESMEGRERSKCSLIVPFNENKTKSIKPIFLCVCKYLDGSVGEGLLNLYLFLPKN
jgi:hypothetical protein